MASASALPHHTPLVFRRAQPGDLTAIMDLISQARDLLRASDIPQWQGVHPTRADVMTDISRGWEYVLANDTTIAASAALWQAPDPNYETIYEGQWARGPVTATEYATIHRTCVSPAFRGQRLAQRLVTELLAQASALGFHEVRIDTHELNHRMRHVIETVGFQHAGTVRMNGEPTDLRLVYQLFS